MSLLLVNRQRQFSFVKAVEKRTGVQRRDSNKEKEVQEGTD